MVERLFKVTKVTAVVLLAAAPVACQAAENFAPYSQAKDQIAAPVQKDSISPQELREWYEKKTDVHLFDARAKTEFDREHILGARLPRTEEFYRQIELYKQQVVREAPSSKAALETGMRDVPHHAVIVTYCNSHCGLSKNLMLDLQSLGFTNVHWLDGGIDVWREKGYPLESEKS